MTAELAREVIAARVYEGVRRDCSPEWEELHPETRHAYRRAVAFAEGPFDDEAAAMGLWHAEADNRDDRNRTGWERSGDSAVVEARAVIADARRVLGRAS